MKNLLIGVLLVSLILIVIFISRPSQSPLTLRPQVLERREIPLSSGQFVACENYAMGKKLGYEITTNNQAFDILKEYWWGYPCPVDNLTLEDCIPMEMTGDEAIQKKPAVDPYFRYTTLTLENNQTIQAWVLNWNHAVDRGGNIYGCYFD